jgi:hypothetical protein
MLRRSEAGSSGVSKRYAKDNSGGGGGIRTHETLSGLTVFKTAGFNRSPTPPQEGDNGHCSVRFEVATVKLALDAPWRAYAGCDAPWLGDGLHEFRGVRDPDDALGVFGLPHCCRETQTA